MVQDAAGSAAALAIAYILAGFVIGDPLWALEVMAWPWWGRLALVAGGFATLLAGLFAGRAWAR